MLGFPSRTLVRVALALALVPNRDLDRRIVDRVDVGVPASELAHGFAGQGTVLGAIDGAPYRQTSGWLHVALKTFEDTDVTIALTFVKVDSVSHRYDVVVDDSVIATKSALAAGVVEVAVPFSLTKGKTNIALVLRARDGLTPAVREIRTIQDHNEVDHLVDYEVNHSTGAASSHSFGVSR